MQKNAQLLRDKGKRNILNKLREMTNVSGIAAEKFFNPEFQRVMESLREKDDTIRSIVAGEAIGDGDPGADPVALKTLVKSVNSNINRREYMSAIADLGRFHKKVDDLVQELHKLNFDVDAVHNDFLFKELGDDQKKYLQEMKSRFASIKSSSFHKEASIMDFFHNIGTKRGRALAAWEKRYPKQVAKLKKDSSTLLSKSESLLGVILSALKEMASARSVRNVDSYVKASEKITKAYAGYDKVFRDFYNSNVKGFLEKIELVAPTVKAPDAKELGQQQIPVGVPPTVDEPPMAFGPGSAKPETVTDPMLNPGSLPFNPTMLSPNNQHVPPAPILPKVQTIPYENFVPADPVTDRSAPPAMSEPVGEEYKSDQIAKEMWGPKAAHYKFWRSLETLSQENPVIIASYIKKYAFTIRHSDPNTARDLLDIVKAIKV